MIYTYLEQAGFDVLMDDRNERPGVMFSELDLLGIPHRIVIGERGIKNGVIEYKYRGAEKAQDLPLDDISQMLQTIGNSGNL